jgi:hypothetical protein
MSVVTFLVQAGLSTIVLKRAGLGRTVGALPAAVTVGGLAALAFPGLATAGLARGLEGVLRNSLFRSGYEVLFAPIPRQVKRATKTLVDVGGERMGDILGGGLVALILVMFPTFSGAALLVLAILFSIAAMWLARQLQQGYVDSLEANLVRGAVDVESLPVHESTTRATLFRTLGVTGWNMDAGDASAPASTRRPSAAARPVPEPSVIKELHSGDPARVRTALTSLTPTGVTLPHLIPLLAWDDVAADVIGKLRETGSAHLETLVQALLDPARPFAIRRRMPQVLVAFPSDRTAQGLFEGLTDLRFEVRYRCSSALRRVVDASPSVAPSPDSIMEAVRRETSIGRRVWAFQRLLDREHESEGGAIIDSVLRERANTSLVHVFTLLSLAHSKDAIRLAFRGLHTDDAMVRGTALEYIESLLPRDIWGNLAPFLDDDRSAQPQTRPTATILADLMDAQESIEARLEALRDQRPPR